MDKVTLLVVDDEKPIRDLMVRALGDTYTVLTAADAELALQTLAAHPEISLMLSDIRMPGADGLQLLHAARRKYPNLICILITAFGTVAQAVDAMKSGAVDFIMKPVDLDVLDTSIATALQNQARANDALQPSVQVNYPIENMIGASPAMERVFDRIRRAAPTPANILILGANGTGKDLVAHALHNHSPRARAPFLPINCGAISPSLIESELFGYEKGAFTDAKARKAGIFEAADHGTVFLDEIGELPLEMQTKLLRVLENRQITRVGGVEPVDVDVRIIAATNQNLRARVKEGSFRQDLFFRLNVIDIQMPSLKEHKEDIPLLVAAFIRDLAKKNHSSVTDITPAAERLLEAYDWPGNVRELRNTIEKMIVLASGTVLDVADVPEEIQTPDAPDAPDAAHTTAQPAPAPTGRLDDTEKSMILAALQACGGNRSAAARKLGIARRTLYRKLDEYAQEGTVL